jgi:hypothetical protein
MFRANVPLVDLYWHVLPAARASGYWIVVTVLARQADAPSLYQDIKRYWSSLHDVSGPDVLLIFAAPDAANQLDDHGLRHRTHAVTHRSDDLAFTGRRPMHWMGPSPADDRPFRSIDVRGGLGPDLESFGRLMPRIGRDDSVERDQSLEVGSLARLLGLRESDLPCLTLTLLHPTSIQGSYRAAIPLQQVLGEGTFYTYVKLLVEQLEGFSADMSGIDRRRTELRRALTGARRRVEAAGRPLRRREEARRMVEAYARMGCPQAGATALSSILDLTERDEYGTQERTECIKALGIVREAMGDTCQKLTPKLRSLIDLSSRFAEFADCVKQAEREVSEMEKQIGRLEAEQCERWQRLRQRFEELAARTSAPPASPTWDFFIAYSSADRSIAERVLQVLSPLGRVFLDSRCLLPGDRWPERVRSAQDQSRCTVAIVTKNTPNGWYVESEHLHAIELVRKKGHTLIPVLFGEGARLPYGMDQVQAVRLSTWSELDQLPALVRDAANAPPTGRPPGASPGPAGESRP